MSSKTVSATNTCKGAFGMPQVPFTFEFESEWPDGK